MADTKTIAAGVPVPSTTLVQTDRSTIIGDGSHQHPLIAIGGGSGITIEDEGSPIAGNPHGTVNFVGAGVTATDVGGVATVTIPGGGGGGIIIEDEGSPIAGNPHGTVNFVGAGVAATNVGGVATVTVPGGISGITVQDEGVPVTGNPHSTVNFVGAGVTATDVGGVATVTVPGGITVQDEGSPGTGNPHGTVNFVGAGVTATDVAGVATVTIPGGGSGIAIQDEGSPVTGNPHSTVNFVGAGVTATDVAGVATITVPGGAALSSANPVTISDATDSPGVATDASRSDHLHAHGDRGGGSLHSLFTSLAPGFASLSVVTPSPVRVLDSVFQPSVTRPTLCIYSADIMCTLTGGVGAAGSIQLLSDSANPPTTIRCEFFLDTGGNLGAGEEVTNIVESLLIYLVPQGHFVSLTTVPSAGGPAFELDFSTEINL